MSNTNTQGLYDVGGATDESVKMQKVAGTLENFPIYGVNDFQQGKPVRGIFLGNETRGKDEKGNPLVVHVFANPSTKAKFGMWERATTSRAFAAIPANTLVDVIYEGQADKHPTDPKKSPPHMFSVLAAMN